MLRVGAQGNLKDDITRIFFCVCVMFGGDTEEEGIKMKIWLLACTIGAAHYDRKKGNGGCCPEGSEGEGSKDKAGSHCKWGHLSLPYGSCFPLKNRKQVLELPSNPAHW